MIPKIERRRALGQRLHDIVEVAMRLKGYNWLRTRDPMLWWRIYTVTLRMIRLRNDDPYKAHQMVAKARGWNVPSEVVAGYLGPRDIDIWKATFAAVRGMKDV